MAKGPSRETRLRQAAIYKGVRRRGELPTYLKLAIPSDVLFDRDRRANLKPISISQALLGDPLPTCSALERGPDPRPFRRTDVLDGLRFPS